MDRNLWKLSMYWFGSILLFCILYQVTKWIAPVWDVTPTPNGALVSGAICFLGSSGLIYLAGNRYYAFTKKTLILILFAIAMTTINFFLISNKLFMFSSLIVIIIDACFGILIGQLAFVRKSLFFIICLSYIFLDVYSIYLGQVQLPVTKAFRFSNMLAVNFPVIGSQSIAPIIPAADYAVWTSLMVGARLCGFPYNRSFLIILSSILATASIGILFSIPMPVLPLMSVFFLWSNRRFFNIKKPVIFQGLFIALVLSITVRWMIEMLK